MELARQTRNCASRQSQLERKPVLSHIEPNCTNRLALIRRDETLKPMSLEQQIQQSNKDGTREQMSMILQDKLAMITKLHETNSNKLSETNSLLEMNPTRFGKVSSKFHETGSI